MIDPKELRIGNLVIRKDLGNGEDRIETILELGKKAVASGPIKVIVDYNDLQPIPLTEDWLRRMDGVEKIESSITVPTWTLDIGRSRRLSISLMAGNTCVWLQAYDPKDSREVTDLVCLFNSDYDGELYVHWFQNLVSAIYRPWN